MLKYEVYLNIDPSVYEKYIIWLQGHIQKMLQFNGFVHAECLLDVSRPHAIKVVYSIENAECLDDYFKHHADAMRQEALDKFEGMFQAERRIFEVMEN